MVRLFLLVALLWTGCSTAEEPVDTFIYAGADSQNTPANAYVRRVLRAALDQTRPLYGDFRLEAGPAMPDRRQMRALTRSEPHAPGLWFHPHG